MGAGLAIYYGLVGVLDAACAGFRQSAGRSALINKRDYLIKATLRGALAGVLADAIAIVWLEIVVRSEHAALRKAAEASLVVSIPLVVVFVVATMARLTRSLEARSIISGVLFGPLTFLRPYAIVLCGLVAVVAQPHLWVATTVALFLLLIVWWTRAPWPVMNRRALTKHRSWGDLLHD